MGKILIINKGFSDNLGDQAINLSLVSFFKDEGYQVEFQDLTFSKKDDTIIRTSEEKVRREFGVKNFLNKIGLYKWLWAIKNVLKIFKITGRRYDFVIIGGGQLILSNSLFPISIFLWSFCLGIRKQSYYFLSVGFGEKFSSIEKKMFKFSLTNAQKVLIRDTKSLSVCKIKFHIEKCEFSPDASLLFPIERFNHAKKECKNRTLIGIVDYMVYRKYNAHSLGKEQYYDLWYNSYIDGETSEILLFYTTKNDLKESRDFQRYVKQKHNCDIVLLDIKTINDLAFELNKSYKIISGRMHALLLGEIFGCEIIPYKISHKIQMFCNEYALESVSYQILKEELVNTIRMEILRK